MPLQTLLRLGDPISQLAYVEVHLHVQPDNHVKCELIRVSQYSKALQALGLQDASPSKPAAKDASNDTDTQPVQAPAQSSAHSTAEAAAKAAAESAPAAEQPPTVSPPAGVQAQAADQHSSVDQQSEAVLKLPAVSQSPFRSDSAGQQQQLQQQPQQKQKQQQQQQSVLSAEVVHVPARNAAAALPAGMAQRRLRTVSSEMSPRTATVKSSARHHRQDTLPDGVAETVLVDIQGLN